MSGLFKSARKVFAQLQRTLATTSAMPRVLTVQRRGYRFTSIPDYDMTAEKFRKSGKDTLGCYMKPKEFQAWYEQTCKRLQISVELDSRTSSQITQQHNWSIDDIRDIHDQPPSTDGNIRAPIVNVAGQEKTAPTHITWPAQYSDPVALVGGMIRNVLYASSKAEVERNLQFTESIADKIDEGEGELASVVQYYVGRGAPIPFSALNFLRSETTGQALAWAELTDKEAIQKSLKTYLDGILPGISGQFKVDMEKQAISAVHVQSPHSSIVVKYKLKDGRDGYMGAEVGRPSFTYVKGELVQNAHEQVVDPAVFQSMNRQRPGPKELPRSISDYMKIEKGLTPENFFKTDPRIEFEELSSDNQPLSKTINLVDTETEKGQAVYLSDGVPAASIVQDVPYAGRLAKVLYFLTGQHPWEALRFGGYFAHDALTGQSRACEALVVFGCDLSGIEHTELLPVLSDLEPYDLSQDMRESVYENILYAELNSGDREEGSVQMFSKKTARDYLSLSRNAFVTMRIYKDLLTAATQKIEAARKLQKTDPEAEKVRDLVLSQTRNFSRRYSHVWAIASYITISLHKTYGADVFVDAPEDGVEVSSGTLIFMGKFINEKIKELDTHIEAEPAQSGTKTVRQNSLELATQSLRYINKIKSELGLRL